MAQSVNDMEVIGRVGQDPEVRSTNGGSRVATFSVATSVSWQDDRGEWQERTTWHRVEGWDKQADYIERRVHKGDLVCVKGSMVYGSYRHKEYPVDIPTAKISPNKIVVLLTVSGDKTQAAPAAQARRAAPAPTSVAPASNRARDGETVNEDDDDLPF